jgi:hypothetical protein
MKALRPFPAAKLVGHDPSFLTLAIVSQALSGDASQGGVQLRDYFASKVMAQIHQQWPKGHRDGWDGMATMAYSYADAMIRVRNIRAGG